MYINTKSEFSFLNSLIKIDDYLTYALAKQLSVLCICDIQNTWGCYRFIKKCQEHNIKSIVGISIKFHNQEIYIYAKNEVGLKELYKLNSLYLENKLVELKDNQDLIYVFGNGCVIQNLINENEEFINKLQKHYHHFFIGINEINENEINVFNMCQKYHLKYLNITPKTYLYNEDNYAYQILLAIRDNKKVHEYVNYQNIINHLCFDQNDKYNQYNEIFIQDINYDLTKLQAPKPKYPYLKSGYTSIEYLKLLSIKGLKKRFKNQVELKYYKRLEQELQVIAKLSFADYFLIVWDIVKFAKLNNIYVGPGRGSVGGCLIAYAIGITEIDPIKYNLLFARFLNEYRSNMPDIDLDFEDSKRQEIIDYIMMRFGKDYVCKIGTIARFLAKSTFHDVTKACGYELNVVEKISKTLNSRYSFNQNLEKNAAFNQIINDYPEFLSLTTIINKIEGLPRQTSIHAAGVIIASDQLYNYCAINEENVSMAESYELEAMGLLKMDILALSNLTFIHNIVDEINISNPQFNLTNINMNDQKTFALLQQGNTIGVFQVDSLGMRNALRIIKPQNIDDIALTIALYRPGPKEFIPKYQQLKAQFKINNKVDALLKESSGIIVYQEQIMQIAHLIANYNLEKADILRRSISKKNALQMHQIKQDFITSSIKNGFNEEYANDIFNKIEKFASYGFNKAHAYGYAYIVYQMAYLKANYPLIFYKNLFYYTFISNKKEEFIAELQNMHIKLIPPSLLESNLEISIIDNNLCMGLLTIKSIGLEKAQQIIINRQELSINPNFLEILNVVLIPSKITKLELINMIHAGCFDFLQLQDKRLNHHSLIATIENNTSLYNINETSIIYKEEYDKHYLSMQEYNVLNINLKYDIFNAIIKNNNKRFSGLNTIDYYINKNIYNFYCVIHLNSIKEIKTKNNDPMAFLQVNSQQIYDLVLFPDEYLKNISIIKNSINKYLILQVNKSKDNSLIVKGVYEQNI